MNATTPLAPALLDALLDRMAVARLAVVAEDGAPEALPIVFARVDDTLFSPIDGKPKTHARLARLARIAAEPRVGLVLDHYAADWRELWWLRLRAQAVADRGAHPLFAQAVAALQTKYPQYRETPLFKHEPCMIVMRWTDTRWWAAAGEAGLERWLARPPGA